jgi:protease-4
VVVVEGEILDGEQSPGAVGGRSLSELLRRAREDETIKALVLRVNSPGGSAFASEQIRRALELTRAAGKPVVISMGDVAASGGYWIATAGDAIFSDPSTITGSIGVFGLLLNFPNTLGKIGVRVDGVRTTAIAGGFDPRRPLNTEIGRMIQAGVDKIYRDFLLHVAKSRKLSTDEIDAVAQGRVWTGAQAAERGLIDSLGGLQAAIDDAAKRAGLIDGDYQLHYVEAEPSPWERFVLDVSRNTRAQLAASALGLPALLPKQTRAELTPLLPWLTGEQGPALRTFSHCFCEL